MFFFYELISSILIEFINSILLQCTYNLLNYEFICNLISKKDILYWLNIYNFIYYLCYKWIKTFLINLYFYMIQFFLIFIYNNMPNKFIKSSIYYILLEKIIWKDRLTRLLKHIKINRLWRGWYRFYYIDYLKILFFIFCVIIFILMWKRRSTYRVRFFAGNLIKFYLLSLFFSFILAYIFSNTFISISLSLFLSFFCVLLTLN